MSRVPAAAGAGGPSIGRWRWQPSPLGLLLLIPVAALLFLRVFPALLLSPFLLPLLRRGGFMAIPFFLRRIMRRRNRPPDEKRNDDDDAIEGKFRHLDDE